MEIFTKLLSIKTHLILNIKRKNKILTLIKKKK